MDTSEHVHLIYVILAAAVATFLTRIGGYVMITQMKRIPPRMEAALNAVPAAVLSTLVAPAFFYGGWDVAARCSSLSLSACAFRRSDAACRLARR